jgi:ribose transport system substrate-binding protein
MRTIVRAVLLPLIAAVGLLAATSAGARPTAASAVSGKTVCYLEIVASHPYATPANKAFIATVKAAGVKVIELSAEIDVQKQASQMDQCIAQNADAVDIVAVDSKAIAPALAKAKAAGIPVWMSGAAPVKEDDPFIVGFSGPSDVISGNTVGTQMAKALKRKGNIVVIQGVAGLSATPQRLSGFMDGAKKAGADFKILTKPYCDYNQQKALVASRDILTKYGEQIDGVFAEDDTMAAGFLQALKESGIKKKIVVMGVGGTKDAFAAIRAGRQYGTVLQSPIADGNLAGQTILKILAGQKVPRVLHFEQPFVWKGNIAKYKAAY